LRYWKIPHLILAECRAGHAHIAQSIPSARPRGPSVQAHLPITPPCRIGGFLRYIGLVERFDHPNQIDLSMLGGSRVLSCFDDRRGGLCGWHEQSRLGYHWCMSATHEPPPKRQTATRRATLGYCRINSTHQLASTLFLYVLANLYQHTSYPSTSS